MSRIEGAREAFEVKDVDSMIERHSEEAIEAPEKHSLGGENVKSLVYGGLDGIVTMFSIVAGVVGASEGIYALLIVAVSGLVADAISMGMGDYVSERAEIGHARAEREREMWETENYEDGERVEMEEIYRQRGLSDEDARRAVQLLMKNRDLFVDTMMVEELGLMGWDADDPWRQGLVTFISFLVFGAVPLLPYLPLFALNGFHDATIKLDLYFAACSLLTLITMFLLGAFASRWSADPFWRMGLQLAALGTFAALSSFIVAYFLESSLGVHTL